MCASCIDRARRLRELTTHFEALAREAKEPLHAESLWRSVAELKLISDQLTRTCGEEIVWAEDDAAPDAESAKVVAAS